jgi:3-oxoacyl-[acyl-carrier protein] reductase
MAPYNILVNCVSPGFTRTELTDQNMSREDQEKLKEIVPIRRLAQPDEIARLVLFLASDANSYITAQNIVIDGGFTNV